MKVICCGSRSWADRWTIHKRLATYPIGTIIVHGASSGGGADLIVDELAHDLGLPVIRVPVNDQDRERARRIGRPRFAPLARNLRMLDEHPDADHLDAYWCDESPGTGHMVSEARRRGLPVTVIPG